MPGLTIYSTKNNTPFKHPVLDYFPNYKHKIIKEGPVNISSTAYDEYPIKTFITSEYTCIIEGFIYESNPSINNKLEQIFHELFQKGTTNLLKKFINETDGEYIIACCNHSSNQVFIFNDYLGRLPFYFSENETSVVTSREISFITENLQPKLSKFACAEFLLFGYPLGNKTLHENCFRLTPATLLIINSKKNTIRQTSVLEFNFERTNCEITQPDKIVKSLVKEFNNSISKRAKEHPKITLSLSGGLDSRAIMGSLDKLNIDYQIKTYNDYNKTAKNDIKVVKELTKEKKDQFKIINLQKTSQYHKEVLLGVKKGLNFSGMSFILDYFEKINEKKTSFWTGDGGDKVLTNLHPLRIIFSKDDLLNYLLSENEIFNITEVCKLLNINKRQLKSHLKKHLNSYPEQKLRNKHLRFMIMERGFKWLFEGEDRNRYYFPSITPFYSTPFFKLAMEVPQSLKYDFELYENFLKEISPSITSIPNANWDFSIKSTYKIKFLYFKQSMKSWLKLFVKYNSTKNSIKESYHYTYTQLNQQLYFSE